MKKFILWVINTGIAYTLSIANAARAVDSPDPKLRHSLVDPLFGRGRKGVEVIYLTRHVIASFLAMNTLVKCSSKPNLFPACGREAVQRSDDRMSRPR
ncbi:hypothetical protein [Mucilaginibacter panaciglaebae]|uniref:hypothetical protein n=1 Tax=Mucilaginibacter panaciglaebae TaxID=502331 RepID=UPI0031ECDBF2